MVPRHSVYVLSPCFSTGTCILACSSYDQGIITQSLLPMASAELSVDLNMTDDVAD